MHIQRIQDVSRTTPLRVDARRNLEHVLRAAREVFGELGYGAPMEDVARRARVGVGTVYRRFPSKDVLVRRIAEEETARLTDQARSALGQEEQPWSALSRFLRTSVASGAGRLLPPRILRAGAMGGEHGAASGDVEARVPQQRQHGLRLVDRPVHDEQPLRPLTQSGHELRDVQHGGVHSASEAPSAVGVAEQNGRIGEAEEESGTAELLEVVGRLVERAREAGELRRDVTVGDVLLVIATAAPSLPDPEQQAAASARLLDILLEGLRSRPDL